MVKMVIIFKMIIMVEMVKMVEMVIMAVMAMVIMLSMLIIVTKVTMVETVVMVTINIMVDMVRSSSSWFSWSSGPGMGGEAPPSPQCGAGRPSLIRTDRTTTIHGTNKTDRTDKS